MDIPSIKFKYFEKLKLYHDYLSPGSVFQQQKKSYWDQEKLILLWAFSELHQHLYTSINSLRILEAFKELKTLDIKSHFVIEELERELSQDGEKINYVMGNLVIKDFADCTEGGGPKNTPTRIRINRKGLLVGEILNESYCKNKLRYKNFRIYKLGIFGLVILISFSILTIFIIFLNQLVQLFCR